MASTLRVIDAHLHLDDRIDGPAINAARALNDALAEAGIARGVVLHLATQRWSAEEVAAAVRACDRLVAFVNVHPYQANALGELRRGLKGLGYIGLKLHPRLQHFSLDDPRTANLVREAGALSAPVVIDAFPDGDWLMQGFDPLAFARLCNQCPETRIVVAHFGGHHVIDCMMLAKRISNMYFDLSYSLLYYRGSAVTANMTYAMRSLKHRRVFYGSDYPDRSVRKTLSGSIAVLSEAGFGREELDRILYLNAEEFYGWQDS